MNDIDAAKLLISCLDLTSLSGKENNSQISKLCEKAIVNNVAAVCTYSKFIPQVYKELKDSDINIATVVNFPTPKTDIQKISAEIKEAIKFGANEIDAVFPYDAFISGDIETCESFLSLCREETKDKAKLKIILETGELKKTSLIYDASKLCINYGVDFIKTSTGKTDISATPETANIILEAINQTKSTAGFKASGGIKTLDDAKKYFVLANAIMGPKWVSPHNFRIGASSLLDDLLDVIDRGY